MRSSKFAIAQIPARAVTVRPLTGKHMGPLYGAETNPLTRCTEST